MSTRTILGCTFALATTLLLPATAHAQLFRAYLAPDGSDANPCTLAAPCRLLPAALTAVADGGEVWMLDSANYNTGPVNITKSVTILAVPGAVGSVVAMGGDAVDIATAGAKVALRNLVIVPLAGGGGTGGINMTAGTRLVVENCLIANVPGAGIAVNAGARVRVTDTTIRDNGSNGLLLQGGARATVTRAVISGSLGAGIYVNASAAGTTTTADIADSTIDGGSGTGVSVYSGNVTAVAKVSVRDSRVIGNNWHGLSAQSDAGASVTLSASNNMISNNGYSGIGAFNPGVKVWASGNTVSDNVERGFYNISAVFESAGNNALRNNTIISTGTINVIQME